MSAFAPSDNDISITMAGKLQYRLSDAMLDTNGESTLGSKRYMSQTEFNPALD